jgi:hypothetical protein
MWLISYLGPSASNMGGNDTIGFFTGMVLVAVFSPFILFLAIKTGLSTQEAKVHSARIEALGSRGMEMPMH